MRNLFLLVICFFAFSCSDSGSSNSEIIDQETSNIAIVPPEWIYGKWTNIDEVNNVQSYEFTEDDIIYTLGNTEFISASFKEGNTDMSDNDPNGHYSVTNESTDTSYLYSQYLLGEEPVSTYYFEKSSDNSIKKIDYVGDTVFELELIKEE